MKTPSATDQLGNHVWNNFFQGQRTYLGPGLLHLMETLPCVKVDIPALFSNSARSPEEAITQLIHTARRTQPGVLYIPHLLKLWDTVIVNMSYP